MEEDLVLEANLLLAELCKSEDGPQRHPDKRQTELTQPFHRWPEWFCGQLHLNGSTDNALPQVRSHLEGSGQTILQLESFISLCECNDG